MKLSTKISALTPSPTVALNSRANELRSSGINVLNFAVGEPDFPTPEEITCRAIQALNAGKTKYGPAGGGLPFRQAICRKLLEENKMEYRPEQIVCGIGAKEILFHVMLSILNEGDEVLLPAPCWVSYKEHIKAAGAIPIIIPPNDDGRASITPKTLEKYSTPKTTAIIICSPSNPTGSILSTEELENLGQYLKTKNWWIVSDEIYEYLSFDQKHESIAKVTPELKEKTILVNGMSKGFAMTGWRVGYCAAPESVAKLVKRLQSHSSTCIPPFIEEAATWAIDQGASLMKHEVEKMDQRRKLALSCIDKIPNLSYLKPEGAFYLFIDVKKALAASKEFSATDSLGFCEYLLDKFHVAVVPGEAFDAPGFFRLSYAVSDETIIEGAKRISAAIDALTT
ncbi:MAG: pyridoxal phosphate-dependent aminotransferase [Bdellovibrionota bacterium]